MFFVAASLPKSRAGPGQHKQEKRVRTVAVGLEGTATGCDESVVEHRHASD